MFRTMNAKLMLVVVYSGFFPIFDISHIVLPIRILTGFLIAFSVTVANYVDSVYFLRLIPHEIQQTA